MTDTLIELQTKLSFQEQGLEELNEVVVSQQGQIDRLTHQLELLRAKLEELEDDRPIASGNEKPPHY